MFVLKLSEELSHHPTIEYYGADSKPVVKPYQSFLTHNQILQHCLGSLHSQKPRPLVITVGTHRDMEDKCCEKINQKNQQLRTLVGADCFRVLYNGESLKDIIFAVNGKAPQKEDRHVAKKLRQKIISMSPSVMKVPIVWFGLEILLERSSEDGVLSFTQCLAYATRLHMDRDTFLAALYHLVHHNVFLYYPEVLPQVVFCDPQVVLTKVTELASAVPPQAEG